MAHQDTEAAAAARVDEIGLVCEGVEGVGRCGRQGGWSGQLGFRHLVGQRLTVFRKAIVQQPRLHFLASETQHPHRESWRAQDSWLIKEYPTVLCITLPLLAPTSSLFAPRSSYLISTPTVSQNTLTQRSPAPLPLVPVSNTNAGTSLFPFIRVVQEIGHASHIQY